MDLDAVQNVSVPAILVLIIVKMSYDALKDRRENRANGGNGRTATRAIMNHRLEKIDERTERIDGEVKGIAPAIDTLNTTIKEMDRSIDNLSDKIERATIPPVGYPRAPTPPPDDP
ncbi:MAG: hypothetical protein ACE5LB_14995, partial [Acidiferrobacterales bacterium]